MRMGKCLIAIRRVKRWKVTGPKLIVTPYSAFDGWQEELRLEEEPAATELVGTVKQRLEKLNNMDDGWHIINVEGHRALPEIRDVDWSVAIADESRFLANPRTIQSKFYTRGFYHVERKMILTGTPDYHDRLDFYQQLYFLNRRLLPYRDYWDFRTRAFHQAGHDFIIKSDHLKTLERVLTENCYFLKRKDVKMGREKEYVRRVLPMPRRLRPVYKTLEDEYILEFNGIESKTIYAMRTHTWMMQLCGGFIEDRLEWPGKINEVMYLLKNDMAGEQVVVFCRFKTEIRALVEHINSDKALKRRGTSATLTHGELTQRKQRRNVDSFRSGDSRVLVAQPTVVAHGVDLKNATAVIYYSQPGGEETRDQSEDRIITLSDEETVLIVDILVRDTVDADARESHIVHEGARAMFERTIKRRQHGRT